MDNSYTVLYDDGVHKCIMFSFDDESVEDAYLSVNQYLIIDNDEAILLDPGSEAIFDELFDAVSLHVKSEQIKYIFFSHQDPDVSGSIAQWSVATNAKFIMSGLWIRFMSHYGFTEMNRVISLPDKGAKLTFGKQHLRFISAHFLHSPGNFSLLDEQSKILFSGDIGAAIIAAPTSDKRVNDFQEHTAYLEAFHKRYMASNKVCKAWVKRVEKFDVTCIAPQHGFIIEAENVKAFLLWLSALECGSDLIDEIY